MKGLKPAVSRTLGAIAALLIFFIFLTILTLRAQQAPLPDLDFEDALWVAFGKGILKVAADDGVILLDIADVKDIRAIAVDGKRGTVWAYGKKTLQAFDFNGDFLFSVEPDEHDKKHVALAVNSGDGTVWLGARKTLFHFDALGVLLSTTPLLDKVRAMALDETNSLLWVATKKTVSAHDDTGAVVTNIDQDKNPDIKDIDVDDASGELWVALKKPKTLRRYASDGTLLFETDIDKLEHVVSDNQGGAWVATKDELIKLDELGQLAVELDFRGSDKIVAMVFDPAYGSVWVAGKSFVSHVGSDGQILLTLEFKGPDSVFDLKGNIRDLALFRDIIPPVINFTSLSPGAVINTNTPDIEVDYSDIGIGVDTTTLIIQANGSNLPVSCTFDVSSAICTPDTPLPEGPVTLSATIKDFAGNESQSIEVSFTIDTIPPVINFTAPTGGEAISNNTPTIKVSYSDSGSDVDLASLRFKGQVQGPPLQRNPESMSSASTSLTAFSICHITKRQRINHLLK